MESSNEAAMINLGLGNPAEVAEFPEFYLCSRDVGQNYAVQINRLCKPVSEVLFHIVTLTLCLL